MQASTRTDSEKCAKLYGLIPTRVGSYEALIRILEEQNQSGALALLPRKDECKKVEELLQQVGTLPHPAAKKRGSSHGSGSYSKVPPNSELTDSADEPKLVMEILPSLSNNAAERLLNNKQLQNRVLNLIRAGITNLRQNITLPVAQDIIQRRKIYKRLALKRNIHFKKSSDIYVFKCEQISEVEKIPGVDSVSGSQDKWCNIDCSYIHLEDDKDLPSLINRASEQKLGLHVLFQNHQEWVLQYSTGTLLDIQNLGMFRTEILKFHPNNGEFVDLFDGKVSDLKEDSCVSSFLEHVKEDDLLLRIRDKNAYGPIIISGVSGLGKSCFFKKMSLELDEVGKSRLVFYESLADFALWDDFPDSAATTRDFFYILFRLQTDRYFHARLIRSKY